MRSPFPKQHSSLDLRKFLFISWIRITKRRFGRSRSDYVWQQKPRYSKAYRQESWSLSKVFKRSAPAPPFKSRNHHQIRPQLRRRMRVKEAISETLRDQHSASGPRLDDEPWVDFIRHHRSDAFAGARIA